MNHLEVVYLQIQGERQLHITHADVHARLLRGDGCYLINCPVLYRRQIKQYCQYYEQQNRAKQYTQNPPEGFLHNLSLQSMLQKYIKKRNYETILPFFLMFAIDYPLARAILRLFFP